MNSMILATSGVSIAINLLLVILVAVCLLLCLVVLMQRPKQEGLGAAFGGGMTDQAFGARTTDVLQKGTVYLGTSFFVITLALSLLVSAQNTKEGAAAKVMANTEEQLDDSAVIEEVEAALKEATAEETPAVGAPEVTIPEVEKPAVEASEVTIPEVETPAVEASEVEAPISQ